MENFVPYSKAVQLKELGFDLPCSAFYNDQGELIKNITSSENYNQSGHGHPSITTSAPLYHQAFEWFSEVKGLNEILNVCLINMIVFYNKF